MKIDAPNVRDYLLQAFKTNHTECYDNIKELGWNSGYVHQSDEVDQEVVPIAKDALSNVLGQIEEQFELSKIPNARYKNADELKKHLECFKDYLTLNLNQIVSYFEKYKLRHEKQKFLSADPPLPIVTTVTILEKYISACDTALQNDELAFVGGNLEKVLSTMLSEFVKIERTHSSSRRKDNGVARSVITIADEYDVQDLLNSILHLHFKDIRKEEPIPSFGPSRSRCDLLLASEGILIEIKTTLKKNAKDIFNDFKNDIPDYLNSEKCKQLILFVHDPLSKVSNRKMFDDLKLIQVKGKSVKEIIFAS